MALIVKKFGGSSVKDAEHVFNVAEIIVDEYKKGNDVIVVVSARITYCSCPTEYIRKDEPFRRV